MSSRWITILGLLVVVGLTGGWLVHLEEEPTLAREAARHTPDSYMHDFIRTDMDEHGLVKRRLSAKYMMHFPDDGSTELLRPRLGIYTDGSNPWYVTSERGWANAGNELIRLSGVVRIWSPARQGRGKLEVITRDLEVWPKIEYAETDKAAILIGPSSITHAVGLRVKLGSDRLELLHEVKSHYEVKAARE